MVLRDSSVAEDAQTLSRQGLTRLRGQLQSALSKPGIKMSVETRAHLSESVARIAQGQHRVRHCTRARRISCKVLLTASAKKKEDARRSEPRLISL
jgi:hypothetical protein